MKNNMTKKQINGKKLKNERLTNLIDSLGGKIDQLNKKEVGKSRTKLNTIEVVCSQDDIERTAKRKK